MATSHALRPEGVIISEVRRNGLRGAHRATVAHATPWSADDVSVALRETARRFFETEAVPHMQRWAQQRAVDRSFWRAAGDLGLLCIGVPEEYSGGGGSITHDLIMLDEQVRVGEAGFGNILHRGIVAHYLVNFGTERQKETWLPAMASGHVIAAIAMTEPGAGSDLANISTTARRDGDQYVINGAKTFITNGGSADLVLVAAKSNPVDRRGMSLFLVDTRDCPGFSRGRVLDKIGQHSGDTAELVFTDVRVPVGNLLGSGEGRGFAQLMNQLPLERLQIAVVGATMAERAVDLALEYTKQRQAFGKTLFDLQHIRFELAECATLARVARVFVDDCVHKLVRGELDTATASMAKYWVTDTQGQIADRCLQLFGGYGYTTEFPIARLYADSRAQRIYGGTNEIMKELISRSI
jgi:acyl-CoA dehydrogenase